MTFSKHLILGLVGALSVTACDDDDAAVSRSLVDAGFWQSKDVSADEAIEVFWNLGGGLNDEPTHILSYQIGPGNTLKVAHLERLGATDRTIAEEVFQLPANVADNARTQLWRLRPRKLGSFDDPSMFVRPIGCEPISAHDVAELNVAFLNDNDTSQVTEDDLMALFELPSRRSCDNDHARQARQLLSRVIEGLPKSRVTRDFLEVDK
ncbi:hypothetical protein [Aurantiacibacter zhengii]|uniref:Uncharacterized protein n=1 Tax=Aurantiacibacter zhengii TaxID=2307003 RepID=A0A418NP05_9SPHN|nr:hypothetical protein [Aurantiacibacter zhengii]RIV83378.1 hypothetical protein D2V07_16650 [Aurantiacibacter zhengii]